LNDYYDRAFTYIELGDEDELWENVSFEDFEDIKLHEGLILKHRVTGNKILIPAQYIQIMKQKGGMPA
jgi:hypothetical protein